MKTPKHWQNKNFLANLLYLPSCLYAFATWCRICLNKPQKVNIPVICVGNLTAGGSGKTPVAVSLARLLKQKGKNPFFISRGYGGKLKNVIVDRQHHSSTEVGDEPLLLAREAPVVINPKRFEAAKKAVENGADVIIMDDGFQNPQLYKNKSLLVIDGAFGLGNTYPIPAGPMREFLSEGIKRADAVVMLGKDQTNILSKFRNLPVFFGAVIPVKPQTKEEKTVAFAGIGRPQKFYQSLEECGINVVKTFDFPDHHFYSEDELNDIVNYAQKIGADIYTTSKDMVKIPVSLQSRFKVLEIEIKWQDEVAISKFISE